MAIDKFSGEFDFLSNFFLRHIIWDGMLFPSSEHAYQAAKTFNMKERELISKEPMPGKAKRLGKNVCLREHWEDIKISIMMDILRIKFSNSDLKQKLLNTGNEELIEGNNWNDRFFGICNGVGQNWLGRLLMALREELQNEENGS